jgi:hypothetical protein
MHVVGIDVGGIFHALQALEYPELVIADGRIVVAQEER